MYLVSYLSICRLLSICCCTYVCCAVVLFYLLGQCTVQYIPILICIYFDTYRVVQSSRRCGRTARCQRLAGERASCQGNATRRGEAARVRTGNDVRACSLGRLSPTTSSRGPASLLPDCHCCSSSSPFSVHYSLRFTTSERCRGRLVRLLDDLSSRPLDFCLFVSSCSRS